MKTLSHLLKQLVGARIPIAILGALVLAWALTSSPERPFDPTEAEAVQSTFLGRLQTDRLMGRDTAGAGAPEELTVGGGVEFTGAGGIQTAAFTGNVTKAAGGTVLTIPANTVTYAMWQDVSATDRLLGRDTAAAGDAEELTVGGGVEFTGLGGIQTSAFTGNVTKAAGGTVLTIPADTVTYAMWQNVSATDRLLGRDTAAAGDAEELTVGGGVEFTGLGGIQTSAFTGDVTKAAGGTATTIAALAVQTGMIANDAVTYAKLQNISVTDRLLGRDTAAAGDAEELTVGGGIEFTGAGGIQTAAFTGNVTKAAGGTVLTIPADTVTYAMWQNVSATDRLLGRDTAAAGDAEELTVGGGVEFTGAGGIQTSAFTGNVTKAAGGTVLTIPTNTVTYAMWQDVSTTNVFLGRDTVGAGDAEEIAAAAARVILEDVPINRYTMAADSNINTQAAETAHTAVTLASADIATLRRKIEFRGRYQVVDGTGGGTLEIRVRVGGVTGTLVAVTPVIANPTANDFTEIEGWIQIRTIGAAGRFNSYVRMTTNNTPATNNVSTWTEEGAINTGGTIDLVVTTDWSAASALDSSTLEEWEAEVWLE